LGLGGAAAADFADVAHFVVADVVDVDVVVAVAVGVHLRTVPSRN
jgi:hypothetical protein